MEIENALDILGFKDYKLTEISETDLKQHYRMFALMYHPDKNSSEDASSKFLEIKEAYDLLQKNMNYIHPNDEENNYHRILKEYLGIQIVDNKVNEILDNILSVCEKQAIIMLEKMEDEKKFNLMYSILKKYRHVFFLSDSFYQCIEEIKERKYKNEECEIIEFYPNINDLFQHMVYKLHKNGEIYLVPLWHQELIYEDIITKKDFIVRCIPPNLEITELEKDIIRKKYWIDTNNHLHCDIFYHISYIFEKSLYKEPIHVNFGDYKTVSFNPWELNIVKTQSIRWKKEGISVSINNKVANTSTMNIFYDISNKSDILLNIHLSN
jgi:hypothetical protein